MMDPMTQSRITKRRLSPALSLFSPPAETNPTSLPFPIHSSTPPRSTPSILDPLELASPSPAHPLRLQPAILLFSPPAENSPTFLPFPTYSSTPPNSTPPPPPSPPSNPNPQPIPYPSPTPPSHQSSSPPSLKPLLASRPSPLPPPPNASPTPTLPSPKLPPKTSSQTGNTPTGNTQTTQRKALIRRPSSKIKLSAIIRNHAQPHW